MVTALIDSNGAFFIYIYTIYIYIYKESAITIEKNLRLQDNNNETPEFI